MKKIGLIKLQALQVGNKYNLFIYEMIQYWGEHWNHILDSFFFSSSSLDA